MYQAWLSASFHSAKDRDRLPGKGARESGCRAGSGAGGPEWQSGIGHLVYHIVCIPSRGPEERHRECVPVGDSGHHPGSLLKGRCLN